MARTARPAPAAPPWRLPFLGPLRAQLSGAFPFIVVIVLWESSVRTGLISPLFLPALSDVIRRLGSILVDGTLLSEFWVTLYRLFIGFSVATVFGIALGMVVALTEPVRKFLMPLIAAAYPIPKLSLLSLFIIWFGFGTPPIVAILSLSAFFPIFISTVTGITTVDPILTKAAKNLGAGYSQILRHVLLPGALPVIFGGLRIASNLSFVVVIALELYIGDRGMGYLLRWATQFYDMTLLFAVIVSIAIWGIVLFKLIRFLERKAVPWMQSVSIL